MKRYIAIIAIILLSFATRVGATTVGSYTSANAWGFGVTTNCDGETFLTPNDSTSRNIATSSFYIKYNAAPITGNLYSRLYDTTGTFGVDDTPTGSYLAESNAYDASLLTTGGTVVFTFSDTYLMSPNTHYAIVVCGSSLSGAGAVIGRDSNTNGYAGSAVDGNTGSWANYTTYDVTFSVAGDIPSEEEATTTTATTTTSEGDVVFGLGVIIFILATIFGTYMVSLFRSKKT